MKFIFRQILFLFITITVFASKCDAQKTVLQEDEIKRMISAYTYYVVQNIALEVFSVKYPHLSAYTKSATIDWDKEFLSSVKAIDSLLTDALKENWGIEKRNIIHKYSGTDYTSITETEVRKYIDLVFQRSLGKMQVPIFETLLIFKPGYLDNPEKEFSDGYVNNFNTKDLKKTIGINFKIVCPKTWLYNEGLSKSGYSRNYISNFGLGNVSLNVYIEKSGTNFSTENINKFISENYLKNNLSKSDIFISYSTNPKIDDLPTGTILFQRKVEKSESVEYNLVENYHAYYKNYHFIVVFTYFSLKNFEETILIKEKNQKLVRKIVSNIVLLSQWEQKRF